MQVKTSNKRYHEVIELPEAIRRKIIFLCVSSFSGEIKGNERSQSRGHGSDRDSLVVMPECQKFLDDDEEEAEQTEKICLLNAVSAFSQWRSSERRRMKLL